jgi:hypothetical protein
MFRSNDGTIRAKEFTKLYQLVEAITHSVLSRIRQYAPVTQSPRTALHRIPKYGDNLLISQEIDDSFNCSS